MSWTDERVETLKRMWGEGQSASQIAKELGGVTRNAVIGKVHRLGLSNRVAPGAAREDEVAADVVTEAVVAPPAPPVEAVAPAAIPVAEAVLDPVNMAADDEVGLDADAVAADAVVEDDDEDDDDAPAAPNSLRRQIIPAGQPLPPQPSVGEISAEALAEVREVEKKARKLTLMELTERTCKWPIGDPATPDFWFCGLPVQPGKPYCDAHVGVAFQPMSSRRDRRR